MASVTLDIYEGWSREQIKTRCLELIRLVDRYQLIIAMLVEYGPAALPELPPDLRDQAIQINAQRRDDDEQTASSKDG